MRKKRIFLLMPVLAAIIAIIAARSFRPLEVVALRHETNVPVQVYGLGTLEVHTISKVGFKISGTLVKLNTDHGDRVRKGDILALLDSAEQESRVAKASANVERAKAAVLVAKAGEERSRANLKYKERLDQRREGLSQKGFISVEDADEKRAAVEMARAEARLAEGDVASAQAALKDALAQLEMEKVILSQHTLTAPYDSRVVARHKELGSIQNANEPLFTLMDPGTLWAKIHVDEEQAGSLEVGQVAEIRLRSGPGKVFPGKVKRIDIESDRVSEERRAYVSFDNPPEEYHLGEQTEAIITLARLDNTCAVPGNEIRELEGSSGSIWTLENGRLNLRKVSFGHRLLDGRYPISGGLSPECTPVTRVPPGTGKGAKAVTVREEKR